MIKMLATAVAIVALCSVVSLAGVDATSHNLSTTNDNAEICLPCHIPHHSDDTLHPLWNHAYQDGSAFTVWDGATLGSESLTCLGCHDGQTTRDDYYGGHNAAGALTGRAAIGTVLTDDHPVGVEYPTSTRFAAEGTIWGSHPGIEVAPGKSIPLFENGGVHTVECASCHSPHTENDDFLRFSNNGSALCYGCHTAQ